MQPTLVNPEPLSPALRDLRVAILARDPRHRTFLDEALGRLSAAELGELEQVLVWSGAQGHDLDSMAEAYRTIVMDTVREQGFFHKHGRYRYSRLADVADAVYHDPDYMDRYMRGLALTSYLWPNHAELRRYFVRTLPKDRKGTYLEVGPGHGFYFVRALREGSFDRYVGADLSATSIAVTKSVLQHFVPDHLDRTHFVHGDICEASTAVRLPERIDAFVMGEVLEHVEEPGDLLCRIAELAHADTWIHVTTCFNAPAVDHIALFEHPRDVEQLIERAGLVVEDQLLVPYVGKSLQECIDGKLPLNVGYVLRKA